jgi:hypothetical protein
MDSDVKEVKDSPSTLQRAHMGLGDVFVKPGGAVAALCPGVASPDPKFHVRLHVLR